eukprot:scaffold72092_cov72-Phaeocystis_antarctica.AAC.4
MPPPGREDSARCSLPVRRATSRSTQFLCSTLMTPSCSAQSSASSATPSARTRDWLSMTAWLWWRTLMVMALRGANIGSSSNGSPSTCARGGRHELGRGGLWCG